MQAVPGKHSYKPALCAIGRFIVRPYGVCDIWLGVDGRTIELPEDEHLHT